MTFPTIIADAPWSSIEQLLVAQMLASGWHIQTGPAGRVFLCGEGTLVTTQLPLTIAGKRYRVDFAFASLPSLDAKQRPLAVELDGHDFHERTKEQASADRERDRALLARGIPTIRFTGSDVYRDPKGVLAEIVALAHSNARARK